MSRRRRPRASFSRGRSESRDGRRCMVLVRDVLMTGMGLLRVRDGVGHALVSSSVFAGLGLQQRIQQNHSIGTSVGGFYYWC